MSRNAVLALLDEWESASQGIVALLPRLRDTELESGEATDESCTRGILVHVLRAGWGYATWICEQLDFPRPVRRTDPKMVSGRAGFEAAFAELHAGFRAALEPLQDAQLDGPAPGVSPVHFTSRWGESYGVEQMLEHAVCHNLRHRRQLERRTAVR